MKKVFLLLVSSLLLVKLYAQNAPVYHKGFYLSLGLGPFFGDIKAKDGATHIINVSGNVLGMDVEVGGSLQPNLMLHGTVRVQTVISPVVNSVRFPDSYSFEENFVGVGITKYTTTNFFATADVGAAYYTFSIPQTSFQPSSVSTDAGFSFNIKAGREWLLSKKWGLGAALYFSSTSLTNKDPDSTEKWSSNRFGICVHATFNKLSSN